MTRSVGCARAMPQDAPAQKSQQSELMSIGASLQTVKIGTAVEAEEGASRADRSTHVAGESLRLRSHAIADARAASRTDGTADMLRADGRYTWGSVRAHFLLRY